jgi:uncharacterized protein (TIGR03000 family)
MAGYAAPVMGQAVPAMTAPAQTLPPPMTTANAAVVLIKAPLDVRISVGGVDTPRSAAEESFSTPALEPGRTYEYVFKAEAVRDGKPVTATKKVAVLAGKRSEVDFTTLGAVATAPEAAKVTVKLPEDAKLFVDGVACPLVGTVRTFETPKLEPGRQYFYTLKAELVVDGQTVSETRRAVVEAGKPTPVDFGTMNGVQAALR